MKQNIVWLRRDLRLEDNKAIHAAVNSEYPIQFLFIFDEDILDELPKDDARVQFIHQELEKINSTLRSKGSSLKIKKGKPASVFQELLAQEEIAALYFNEDYEPYGIQRDQQIAEICKNHGVQVFRQVDHIIFHPTTVLKDDGNPYTVFTPYSKKWKAQLTSTSLETEQSGLTSRKLVQETHTFPSLNEIGFTASKIQVLPYKLDELADYHKKRDIPAADAGSYLSPHLRFGTVSIRQVVQEAAKANESFLNELIWREFFIQILYHFPQVVSNNFRPKYDALKWRNNAEEFEAWKAGRTGYPLVDAGMRQLNNTGYMHNRVRMVTASFLCKHLLIDWRWGEAYFAEKLLDYELSSNNGNWQWAASTGCDAQPYFRIFNPHSQLKRFDPDLAYCKQFIPELNELNYPGEIVEHKAARERCLAAFKSI